MSVYVGPVFRWPKSKRWPYDEACHLFADDETELHELAQKIGLQRAWYQPDQWVGHYDLTRGKRSQAILASSNATA